MTSGHPPLSRLQVLRRRMSFSRPDAGAAAEPAVSHRLYFYPVLFLTPAARIRRRCSAPLRCPTRTWSASAAALCWREASQALSTCRTTAVSASAVGIAPSAAARKRPSSLRSSPGSSWPATGLCKAHGAVPRYHHSFDLRTGGSLPWVLRKGMCR